MKRIMAFALVMIMVTLMSFPITAKDIDKVEAPYF